MEKKKKKRTAPSQSQIKRCRYCSYFRIIITILPLKHLQRPGGKAWSYTGYINLSQSGRPAAKTRFRIWVNVNRDKTSGDHEIIMKRIPDSTSSCQSRRSLLGPLQVGSNAVWKKKVGIMSLTPMLAQSLFSSQVMHGLRGVSTSRWFIPKCFALGGKKWIKRICSDFFVFFSKTYTFKFSGFLSLTLQKKKKIILSDKTKTSGMQINCELMCLFFFFSFFS